MNSILSSFDSILPAAALAAQYGAQGPSGGVDMGTADMGLLLAMLLVVLFLVLLVGLLCIVSVWKLFKKAGKPGWASLVPFYRSVMYLKITSKPLWWAVLLIIPIVNIPLWIIILRRVAVTFGKGWGFTIGLLLLPFIFYPILAFGESKYKNNYAAPKPMADTTKWALIAAAAFLLMTAAFSGR